MRYQELLMREDSIPRNQFNKVLNDPSMRMGFEAEMLLRPMEATTIDPKKAEWREVVEYLDLEREPLRRMTADYKAWKREHRDADVDSFIEAEFGDTVTLLKHYGLRPLHGWTEDGLIRTTPDGVRDANTREVARDELDRTLRFEAAPDSRPSQWRVINDSSIETEGTDWVAGEVVSPVFQIGDGLEAMRAVFDWMRKRGHVTNESTGLHINLSIEGKDHEDYDFLKMILFYDEQYVAAIFDRLDNSYAEQMRKHLYDEIEFFNGNEPSSEMLRNPAVFDTLKRIGRHFEHFFKKYWSIRSRHNGVFEFRSIGGADYERRFEEIRRRVANMAHVLRIGADPEMYRKAYLRKMYRLLSNGQDERRWKKSEHFLTWGARELAQNPETVSNLLKSRLRVHARLVDPERLFRAVGPEPYNALAKLVGWPKK